MGRDSSEAGRRQAPSWVQQALLEEGTTDALELVATAAPTLLGAGGVGIQVVEEGVRRSFTSVAAPFVVALERCGPRRRRPGELAARTGEEVQVNFPDDRRPALSQAGVAAGIEAVWSLPLRAEESVFGALTIYAASPGPWTQPGAGRRVAEQVESIVTGAASRLRLQQMNAHLWRAMETRTIIGQAQGMLMVAEGMSAEEAFDLLTRASQHSHRKLREVAADVVARRSSPPDTRTRPDKASRAS